MLISKYSCHNFDEELELCSQRLELHFPQAFVDFLRKYNGGETPNTTFSLRGVSSDIRAFYGLGDVKYSFSGIEAILVGTKRYLPIALDSFGNNIVMDVDSGAILFYDHEAGAVKPLAEDFRAFVEACKSEPISPASCKSIAEREQDLIQRGRGSIITDALRQMWQSEIEKYQSISQEKVAF